jgi:hypothetical protein
VETGGPFPGGRIEMCILSCEDRPFTSESVLRAHSALMIPLRSFIPKFFNNKCGDNFFWRGGSTK